MRNKAIALLMIVYLSTSALFSQSSIAEVASLEIDNQYGLYHSLIQVDSDTYLLAYTGLDSDGFIKTITISADGSTITEVESLVHDNVSGAYQSLVKVDSDTYLLAYQGQNNDGYLKTFTVAADGSSITQVQVLEHDTNDNSYNSLVQVDSDTYVLAYTGSSNDGFIKTFTVPADGSTITQVQVLEHDTIQCNYNSLVQVDSDTYLLAYADGWSDGQLKTFTIPADGSTITQVQALEYDVAASTHNALVKIDSDTYAVSWYGYNGGTSDSYVKTFTIPADGSSITGVASMSYSTTYSYYSSWIDMGNNTFVMADAYASNGVGRIKTFYISPDGSSISLIKDLDVSGNTYGQYNSLVKVDANTAALAYMGDSNDGFITTFTIETGLPFQKAVSLASDNSTIAVTFNEAVYNTDGGSGALQTSDFNFALSGGNATLSSATPTSISISGNIYTLGIGLSGTPNGSESLTVTPVANSIYDADGNVAETSQLVTSAVNLNDKLAPTITGVSGDIPINNSTIAVTFSETVYNTNGGSGALQTSDFNFALSGGNATLSSATPTSMTASGNTYTLGIGLSGVANGAETLTVTPVDDGIYDVAGNEASTTQSNNTATLNDGRITIAKTVAYDAYYGTYNSIVQIDADTYVLAYAGNGEDGYIQTFTVSADGSTVTKVASLEHDSNRGIYNSLIQIDSDTYALAYYGYGAKADGGNSWGSIIKLFSIPQDGSTITEIVELNHDPYSSVKYHSLVQVDHDTYALAYYGNYTDYGGSGNGTGGWIKTFTISGGTITQVKSLRHYSSTADYNSFVKVDANTFALAYSDVSNDGIITTFTIPADGSSITQAGTLEHDTDRGFHNSLAQVDDDTYALAYSGPSDNGFIKTFTISADGSSITQVASSEHDTEKMIYGSLIKINPNTMLLAYSGKDNDGFIKTFTIPADGSSITQVISLEHDQTQGQDNSLVQIDADTYGLAFKGTNNLGYFRTFNIAATAAENAPLISSVVMAADNSTIAVTFSEAVFNTGSGSGSLDVNDFTLSLEGGAGTLSSATPTSISISSNTYTLGIGLSGTPNGRERVTVRPAANAIYDGSGNAAGTDQNNNTAFLYDKQLPVITATSLGSYNIDVTVTFNEIVFANNNRTGAITVSDLDLSISGGTATLSSATPTSISGSNGPTFTLGFTLSGMADGNEVMTVKPVANSIYDAAGSVASTTQSNNTGTFAKTLIGEVASLEHDNSKGFYNSFVQIAPNKYAVAYAGYGDDGYIKTFTIAADGTITQLAVEEHDEDNGTYNSLVKVDDNTYALAYSGNGNDGFIKTFTIPADGSTIELIAQWEHDTDYAIYNSFTQVDSNTYALAYTGTGNDGYIKTFTISSDGSNIAVVQTKEHDANQGQYNSFIRMDSDTYLLAYQGYSSDGFIKTFTIPADGSTITQVQSLEHDSYHSYYNSIVQVDYNTYALAYSGTSTNTNSSYYYSFLKTFTIPLDGSSITQVKSLQNTTSNNTGTYHSLIKINSEEYALAYAGYGNDGFIDNFTISSDGDSIKKVWSLEHDTGTGQFNSLIMVDKDTYALAYTGSGNDGFIKTFDIASNDQVAPQISYVSLPYDNSSITLAFNEAVYNTNGGSGSLEASDFVLSITGGTATVAGTPTSISASLGNTYTFGLSLSGTPDGNEVLKVVPATNAIYDANGTAGTTTQSNNTVNLNEKVVPTITGVSLASDNSTLAVTFSESVYNSSSSSGNLAVSDFVFSLTGGIATLSSTTPSSISISGNVYTLGIAYAGLPNGNEAIKVVPASNAIWDGAGNLASTTQSNNTASFNEEKIRAVTSKEHDTSTGVHNSIVKVDDDTYALAYSGYSNDGFIQTFTIPADGATITEVKSLEHDVNQGFFNSLVHVSSNIYALAYSDVYDDGWIKTFSISDDGSTITQLTALEHAGAFAQYNSIIQLDTDTYVLAFTGYGNDGRIKAFTISSSGSISVSAGQVIHDSNLGQYNSLVKVDSNTVALAYSGNGGNGYIKTFTIPSSGASITEVFEYKHDSIYGKHNSFVQVDDDTYALAYSGTGNDGFIKTFTIPADGSAVTQVKKLEHDTENGTYNSLIKVSSGSDTYILAYTGNGNDGYLKTFTISADGTTLTQVYVVEYDTNQGRYNSLVQIDMDTYALAYAGTSDDGFVKTYLIRANDEIPPTIKNVQLAADNSTIAVTFDEAVYSTNNGSGALEKEDFVFSIAGGSATLSSATPTSISASSNTYTLGIGLSGLADGTEVITVKPASNAIFDGGYNAASTTQSNNTATLNDRTGPKISSVALAADNSTIAVTLNEASYKTNSGSGSLEKTDFVFSLTGGTATLSSTTPSSISAAGNVYTLGITISGTPSGSELLKVTPAENAIYDAKGNAASTTQSNNTANLKDKTAPTVSSVTTASDNKIIVVTFSESVFNTNGGSGALDSADFAFSITGGAATLTSATPTSISISDNVYTLGIGLSGTPDGSEVVTVTPVENAIYDAGGNVASTAQTNKTTSLFDQTAPNITSVTLASDNSTISVSFSVDPVYSTNSGSGALDSADFVLSISGGVATLTDTLPTSLSISGSTYTLGIGLAGIPNGSEVLTVLPAENAIYDATGNPSSATQTNNSANLNDKAAPTIASVTTASDNKSIAVTFSEGVFSTNGGSGVLDSVDFALSITGGTATLISTTPTEISINNNIYTLGISLSGTADGSEVLTVVPIESAIFDSVGNVASTTQTNNTANLKDKTAPTVSSFKLESNNSAIEATFSEAVFSKSDGSGALETTDFVLTLQGGAATLSSATPSSISTSGNVYILGIGLSGTPDGVEVLTVTLVDSAIYDAAGNIASVTQNNNSTTLFDQKAPIITSVSPSSDNSSIIVIFSEAVFSKSDGSGVLDTADFAFSIAGGNTTLANTNPTSISSSDSTYTLGLSLSGIPNGSEVVTVALVDSAIFDAAGTAASTIQTNNTTNLYDQTNPVITSVLMASDSTIVVTFSVPVFSTDKESGALDSADFDLFIDGGTATLLSLIPTSVSANGNTYTLGISLSGTPDGNEVLTITPAVNAIFDKLGNVSKTTQINNTVNLIERIPPVISSVSIVTDTTIAVTFTEAIFSNNDGSGVLDSADFVFSLQGGSSTLLRTSPKSISAIVNTYTLGIDLSSTPDGELITVTPAPNAIYDAAGNPADTIQSNNTAILNNKTAPKTPTGLVGIPGNKQVNIIWNANRETDVTKYYVYGGTSTKPTMKMDSTFSVSDTSTTITGLINGTIYFFRISAVDSIGYESGKTADLSMVSGIGSTIIVKQDSSANFVNVQAAIDAALIGDTILVYPGIYKGNINFDGKNVIVGSLYLTTGDTSYISSTIIDGDNFGSVVKFENFEDSTSILSGLTIRNGLGLGKGGGIYIKGAGKNIPSESTTATYTSPTLDNLIIRDNQIGGGDNFYYGGGIYLEFSKAIITGCTIINNTNSNQAKIIDAGGGIYFIKSNPKISNSTIGYNVAATGAGIYGETDHYSTDNYLRPRFTIKSTKAIGNTGDTTQSSINSQALFIESSQSILENCLVVDNNVKSGIETSQYTAIINSTFANNGKTEGHDIRFSSSDSLVIMNSIIFGNGKSIDNGDTTLASPGNIFIYNSILEGGIAGINQTIASGTWTIASEYILNTDPNFGTKSTDNYSLNRYSVGVGTGTFNRIVDDKSFSAPETDIAGNSRPNPSSSAPDIGAYESKFSNRFPKSFTISDGLSDDQELDYTNTGTSLSAHWKQFDDDSTVTYEYAIGTKALNNIVDWTENATDTFVTAMELSLVNDTTYNFSVRGTDYIGQVSDTITTDGVYVDFEIPVINTISESVNDLDWYGQDRRGKIVTVISDNTGIAKHEYSISTIADSVDASGKPAIDDNVLAWFKGDTNSVSINLIDLVEGLIYYSNARVTDFAGNVSEEVSSDGFQMDLKPPIAGTVTKTQIAPDQIILSWSGFSDQTSGISQYEYSLGSQPGSADVIKRTITDGNIDSTVIQLNDSLKLINGNTYYGTIYAADSARNETAATSNKLVYDLYFGEPSITNVSHESGSQLNILDDANITFTVSEPFVSFVASIESSVGDSILFTEQVADSTQFSINLQAPFTSGDDITLTINKLIDYLGNSSDNQQYKYSVSFLADYDADSTIGITDLSTFVQGWDTNNPKYELGPVTGTAPHFKPAPDGVFNNRDGMAFTRMWHWDKNKSGKMLAKFLADEGSAINTTINNDHILVYPPKGTHALEILLDYSITDIEFSANTSTGIGEKGITLSKVDTLTGNLILQAAYFEANSLSIRIDYNHLQKKYVNVNLSYQFIGKGNIVLSAGTHAMELEPIPKKFALHQNYPNPFNPVTTINYDLPTDAHVKIVIYDILGREVIELVNQQMPAGHQTLTWNTRNFFGQPVSAGIYFYQIQASGFIKTRKMVLLK